MHDTGIELTRPSGVPRECPVGYEVPLSDSHYYYTHITKWILKRLFLSYRSWWTVSTLTPTTHFSISRYLSVPETCHMLTPCILLSCLLFSTTGNSRLVTSSGLCSTLTHACTACSLYHAVMLNYAGEYCEYGEYCDACQAAVTVIRSSDAALKSCLEWLTMSYNNQWQCLLDFSVVLQTDRHK